MILKSCELCAFKVHICTNKSESRSILSDFYLDAVNNFFRFVYSYGVKYLLSAIYLDVNKVPLNSLSQICSLSKVAILMPGRLLVNLLLTNILKHQIKIDFLYIQVCYFIDTTACIPPST